MKIIKIFGKIWELTREQQVYSADNLQIDLDEANERAIYGQDLSRNGTCRLLSNNKVRSKAIALIEIEVNGYPRQQEYVIYHCPKGFYCKIQGKVNYLKDILECNR